MPRKITQTTPLEGTIFTEIPDSLLKKDYYKYLQEQFKQFIKSKEEICYYSSNLKLYSKLGESKEGFINRIKDRLGSIVQKEFVKIKEKFEKEKLNFENKLRIAQNAKDHAEEELKTLSTETSMDAGLSGGSSNRPAFQKLIGDAKQKKFDVVLVYKIDRLSRSILDFHQTMKIFQENDISFVSLTQQFNTSTSTGRLMLNILVDFANFEREINVDRTVDSFFGRFYKGLHSGQTPYGYKRENGNNLIVNREQSEIVKQIFNLANEGISTREIANKAELGVDRVKTILDNPIYAGYLTPRKDKHGYHDLDISKWIKGNHEAIIPMELFFAVQKKYRKGQRKTKHIAIFQKLVYCPYCKHNYSFFNKGK